MIAWVVYLALWLLAGAVVLPDVGALFHLTPLGNSLDIPLALVAVGDWLLLALPALPELARRTDVVVIIFCASLLIVSVLLLGLLSR